MSEITLAFDGTSLSLPLLEGAEKEKAIDIAALRKNTGIITLDNGFGNTGSCKSGITFLDGEKGILRYRGYPIEQLAEHSSFIEVSYLLLTGSLPSADELASFESKIASYNTIPDALKKMLDQFPKDAHPMGILSSAFSALAAFYPEYADFDALTSEKKLELSAQMMGQVKSLIAYVHRHAKGEDFVPSNPELGYCADFLNMMFGGEGYEINQDIVDALDVLLILHADHEQNCSASSVRVVGSSQANIFATIGAGVSALWGKLHGGANQAVLEMLTAIDADGGDYEKYINKAKDKSDPFRLMGFGHRVYKNFDPRATIIKKACDTVLEQLNVNDPLLKIAKGLEQVALEDEYFKARNLYPNVDFYSGIIYKALGIPVLMFTPMFVLGRLPGWLSQWKEMTEDPSFRIARPRQIYTGETERNYPSK